MFKYEYVTVNNENWIIGAEFKHYKEKIDEYAKKGYRYVGFIPTMITQYGKFKEINLIFEIQD